MQSISSNLLAAAHSNNRRPFASVLVDDPRIRGWVRNDSVSTSFGAFDARLTNGGTLCRAYMTTANPSVLHIALATVGAAPAFSDVSIGTNNATQYSGVALFNDPTDNTSPNRIDVYCLNQTTPQGIRIKSSLDNGATWGVSSVPHAIADTQQAKSYPQIAAAGWDGNGGTYNPYLFYTTADANNPNRGTNLIFYDGKAGNNNRCTLMNLGIPTLNATPPVSGLGAFQLNSTDFACVITLNKPRGLSESGIYLIWYRDGIWSSPYPICSNQTPVSGTLEGNSQYSVSYPTMQLVNGVYWILATETISVDGLSTPTSKQSVSHLVAFRSTDAIHWTAGDVLAGTDSLDNGYWTSTQTDPTAAYSSAFAFNDFAMSKLLVSGARTFLVGYGRLFQLNGGTTSTLSSTASDYAASTLDVTGHVTDFNVSLPNGPAGQATLNLNNPAGVYNNSNILRRGARVRVLAGYKSTSNDSTDLAMLFTGQVDEVRQQVELGKNNLSVVCKDWATAKLEDWTANQPLEYSSSRHLWNPNISDYGSTIQAQATWTLQSGGGLQCGAPPSGVSPALGIIVANTGRVEDGIFDVKFKFKKNLTNTTAGPVFRYKDNKNFYHLVFNTGGSGTWNLYSYDSSASPTSLLTAPVAPAGTTPSAGQVWNVRVHVIQNQLVCSARQEGTTNWVKILDNTNFAIAGSLKTRTGYMGFGALSTAAVTSSTSNTNAQTGHWDVTTLPEGDAVRFTVGAAATQMDSYSVRIDVVGSPGGTVDFKIIQDNGTGTAPATIGAQSAALSVANQSISVSQIVTGGYTKIDLSTAGGLTLNAGNYWIVMVMNTGVTPTEQNHLVLPTTDTTGDVTSVFNDGNNSSAWSSNGGGRYIYACSFLGAGGAVQLNGYALYSQEEPVTLDYLVREVGTKAGVLTMRPNYFVQDTFANLNNWDTANAKGNWQISGGQIISWNPNNTYGFLRCNVGTLHEMVLECDMTLGANSAIAGGFLFGLQNTSALTSNANLVFYEVEFNIGTQKVLIYALNGAVPSTTANRIFTSTPIMTVAASNQYHIKIQRSGKFILAWLNNALVAAVRTDTGTNTSVSPNQPIDESPLRPAGYVGLVSFHNDGAIDSAHPAATFDNFTITELKEVKDYFVVEENTTGMQALQNLLKYERVKFFGDYDGALRYAYYDTLNASGDSPYTLTPVRATKTSTNRYWVSHYRPFGDYYADRFSGALLDQEGTRFRSLDYTDARSDKGAYHAAAYPIRNARELTDTLEFTAAANPGIQREDRITAQVDALGINGDYVVDTLTFRYAAGDDQTPPAFDMDVVGRKFIATSGEGAG